jgi:hypothetical protein
VSASRVLLGAVLLLAAAGARAANPCGQSGKVKERIADCAKPSDKGGVGPAARRALVHVTQAELDSPLGEKGDLDTHERIWLLVSQTAKGRQIWLDEATGLLWSAGDVPRGTDKPCTDEHLQGNMNKFHVPSSGEFVSAWDDGLKSILDEPDNQLYLVNEKPPLYDPAAKKSLERAAAEKAGRDFLIRCVDASGLAAKPPVRKPS